VPVGLLGGEGHRRPRKAAARVTIPSYNKPPAPHPLVRPQTLDTASKQVVDPIEEQAEADGLDGVRFIEEGVLCEDRLISDIMEARRVAAFKCKRRRPRGTCVRACSGRMCKGA
jgi:hypothetical protein